MSLGVLWEKVSHFLAVPTPQGVRWASAAAGLLILLQAAVIGALLTARSPDSYLTASGPSLVQKGFSLLIGFTDRATTPDIAALLGGHPLGATGLTVLRARRTAPRQKDARQVEDVRIASSTISVSAVLTLYERT